MKTRIIGSCLCLLLLLPLALHWTEGKAEACAACWSGYGPGEERYNKPLADLRILYEKEGRNALPTIREALLGDPDALVRARAATYIAEMKDVASVPILEKVIDELFKRVSFSTFGVGSPNFDTRLKAAHVLFGFGVNGVADRLWERYDRLTPTKKTEFPYLLNALQDPQLTDRCLKILDRREDHQVMIGALETLGLYGNSSALPVLEERLSAWQEKGSEPIHPEDPESPMIYYSALRIKVEMAIFQIAERNQVSLRRE